MKTYKYKKIFNNEKHYTIKLVTGINKRNFTQL